jgi:hypothetical protein
MRSRVGSVSRTLAILLMLAGCASILGVDDYAVRPPAKEDAGLRASILAAFKNTACGDCVQKNCKAELTACASDEPCGSWEKCMAKCDPGNGACENHCFSIAGKSDGAMGDIAMCTLQYCYDSCNASGPWPAYGPACGAATRSDCGAQLQACAGDAECRKYWECLFAESCLPLSAADSGSAADGAVSLNPSCKWHCADDVLWYSPVSVDGGLTVTPAQDLAACHTLSANSNASCGSPGFTCAGRYTYEPPPDFSKPIRVTVRVHDGWYTEIPGAPIPDLKVQPCMDNGSPSCFDDGIAAQSTGRDGTASFDLPTQGTGLPWFFEVTPPTRWSAGASLVLFYTGRPLNRATYLALALGGSSDWVATLKDPKNALTRGDWDPTRAGLFAFTRGCALEPAHRLTVRVDGQDAGATVTQYTDATRAIYESPGVATVFASVRGIEAGLHTISAFDGDRKVSEQRNVLFEKDAVSIMPWFAPAPTQ